MYKYVRGPRGHVQIRYFLNRSSVPLGDGEISERDNSDINTIEIAVVIPAQLNQSNRYDPVDIMEYPYCIRNICFYDPPNRIMTQHVLQTKIPITVLEVGFGTNGLEMRQLSEAF